jgi:excisionase family DNA binding protein
MEKQDKTWTTTELAEAADVTSARIRQLLASGELDGYKLARDWRIPDSVAREWLAMRQVASKARGAV